MAGKTRKQFTSEQLLELLAEKGEMKAQDFLAHAPRPRGDYIDFYPVAALMHAGYIASNSPNNRGGETIKGKLGFNTKDTSVFMCQLLLNTGESFEIDGCPRKSADDFPVKLFITAEGYLRLDELREGNRGRC